MQFSFSNYFKLFWKLYWSDLASIPALILQLICLSTINQMFWHILKTFFSISDICIHRVCSNKWFVYYSWITSSLEDSAQDGGGPHSPRLCKLDTVALSPLLFVATLFCLQHPSVAGMGSDQQQGSGDNTSLFLPTQQYSSL
jgi:hypothetical protein